MLFKLRNGWLQTEKFNLLKYNIKEAVLKLRQPLFFAVLPYTHNIVFNYLDKLLKLPAKF